MWSEAPACLLYEYATALSTKVGDHGITEALQLLLRWARQHIQVQHLRKQMQNGIWGEGGLGGTNDHGITEALQLLLGRARQYIKIKHLQPKSQKKGA
jgi:hypothetical protein